MTGIAVRDDGVSSSYDVNTACSHRLSVIAARLRVGVRTPVGTDDPVVTGMGDDSRSLRAGDMYVALPGRAVHGLQFEEQALERGAVAVLSDRPCRLLPTVVVPDPRLVVGPLASWFYGNPSRTLRTYGITGTNGKTSAAYLLHSALTGTGANAALITGITVSGPRTVTRAHRTTPEAVPLQRTLSRFREEGADTAVMEVSSHAITEHRIDGTHFSAMGFTNLGRDHLDYHGTMDDYFAAKAAMFRADRTDTAVLNVDDRHGRVLAATADVPFLTYSMSDPRADVVADHIQYGRSGSSFTARTPRGHHRIELPLLGPHQVSNALMALTMSVSTGADVSAAAHGLGQLTLIPGRLETVDVGQPFLALVDYVHNPSGQRTILPYLRTLTDRRVIYVLRATGLRDPGKRFPLGLAAGTLTDVVIVTDESPYTDDARAIRDDVAAGARAADRAEVIVLPDRKHAIDLAVNLAAPGDLVLVGGRGCETELVFANYTQSFDDRKELWESLIHRVYRDASTAG